MPSQSRSARQLPRTRGSQNVTFRLGLPRLRDCAAEALPAAETAEAEQGQRSAFCEGAATPEAKAGHRNPGGLDNNNAGASLTADPRRGTLSFVTQKFFCFGAINNRRNYWLGTSFLLSHRMGVYPDKQAVSMPICPLYQARYGAPRLL